MPSASWVQTNFHGGEWSAYASGRMEDKRYKTALSLMENTYPVEEGAASRRPGFLHAAVTRRGGEAKLLPFPLIGNAPYTMELSDGFVRFFSGTRLVTLNESARVSDISTDSPAIVTVDTAGTLPVSFDARFTFGDDASKLACSTLINRTLRAVPRDALSFEIFDAVTGDPFDGSSITWSSALIVTAEIVHELATPYEGDDWKTVRSVQAERDALLLQASVAPQVLSVTDPSASTFAVFDLNTANFRDGPYLDAISGSTLTPNGTTGIVSCTLGFTAYVATTAYSEGDFVTSASIGYRSLTNQNVGHTPATSPTHWAVASPGEVAGPHGITADDIGRLIRLHGGNTTWTWGKIVALSTTGLIEPNLTGSLNIGNMTSFGGLVAAFDGDTEKGASECAAIEVGGGPLYYEGFRGYVGKNFSGASAQRISAAVVYPSTSQGWAAGSQPVRVNLRASNTAPTHSGDGTLLGTAGTVSLVAPVNIASNDTTSLWDYIWIEIYPTGSASAAYGVIAQIQFFNQNGKAGATFDVQLLGAALVNTTAITTWRLGRYSDSTGWPTVGLYYEGRLWLAGKDANHFDASMSNDLFNFAPTNTAGTVTDSHAISYTFNSTEVNTIHWMQPSTEGLVMGTSGGEWVVQASAANNPLTPTSIQAHRATKYKCANIEPCVTGISTIFVQKNQRRLHEYLTDAYGKPFAPNLNRDAKHVTKSGVEQIVSQEDLTPIVWARMGDGTLAGLTYRRISRFSTEDPIFFGWHRHPLGSGRLVESICVGPSVSGTLDTLALVTNDEATDVRHVEVAVDLLDEDASIYESMFLDNAIVPGIGRQVVADAGRDGLQLEGLHAHEGKKVTVFAAGLDCGDFTVADGMVTLVYGSSTQPLFTKQHCSDVTTSGEDFGLYSMDIDAGAFTIPCVVGFTYRTRGQLLRPATAADTGARLGPGFGKTKRTDNLSVLLQSAVKLSFGTDFGKMRPALFRTKGQVAYTEKQLFSGVFWTTLDDDYSYDSQLCWEVTRPYPATICAIGGFITTQG